MVMHYLARSSVNETGVTGDGSLHIVKFDQCLSTSSDINYNSSTGVFTVPVDGLYRIEWSIILGNINSCNTSAGYWCHGSGQAALLSQEPFMYTGNLYASCNPGGTPGAGSDIFSINGSMTFKVVREDADYGTIKLMGRVGGNTTKNITLVYDSFIAITKVD